MATAFAPAEAAVIVEEMSRSLRVSDEAREIASKLFVTRNTEYHVRKDVCVAVKDRRSGEHWAGRLYMREISLRWTRHLVNSRITPNQLTYLMVVAGVTWVDIERFHRWGRRPGGELEDIRNVDNALTSRVLRANVPVFRRSLWQRLRNFRSASPRLTFVTVISSVPTLTS